VQGQSFTHRKGSCPDKRKRFFSTCFLDTFGLNCENSDANFGFSDDGRSSCSAHCKTSVFIRHRQNRNTVHSSVKLVVYTE